MPKIISQPKRWSASLRCGGIGGCRTIALYFDDDWWLEDDGRCLVRCAGCGRELSIVPPSKSVAAMKRKYH